MSAPLSFRTACWLILASLACAPAAWAEEPPAPFRLGIINERPDHPGQAFAQYGQLHRCLVDRLREQRIETGGLVIAQNMSEMGERIRRGDIDALIEGLMPTLILERQTALLHPALLVWRKGQRQYSTLFFTRQDSPIQQLGDLRGRTIVFESERSTSAYFVPRLTLKTAGIRTAPASDSTPDGVTLGHLFAGSELNQAYWVQRGKADAGAFNDGDWERTPESVRRQLRVFHRTQPLPRWFLSFHDALAPATRAAVTRVLLELPASARGRAALERAEGIARFEPLTPQDQAQIEQWQALLADLEP